MMDEYLWKTDLLIAAHYFTCSSIASMDWENKEVYQLVPPPPHKHTFLHIPPHRQRFLQSLESQAVEELRRRPRGATPVPDCLKTSEPLLMAPAAWWEDIERVNQVDSRVGTRRARCQALQPQSVLRGTASDSDNTTRPIDRWRSDLIGGKVGGGEGVRKRGGDASRRLGFFSIVVCVWGGWVEGVGIGGPFRAFDNGYMNNWLIN